MSKTSISHIYVDTKRVISPISPLLFSPFAESLAGRAIATDRQLCERLLDDSGVALLPGSVFGLSADALTARLAYVDFDGAALLDNLDALDDDQVKSSAAKMLKGIDRLGDWLH